MKETYLVHAVAVHTYKFPLVQVEILNVVYVFEIFSGV